MTIGALDWAIVAVMALSALLGFVRGAVREIVAVLSWFVAWFVAKAFAAPVQVWLPAEISGGALRHDVAFALVFLATLLVMSLVGLVLSAAVQALGLGIMNRALGAVTGVLRGVLIVLALVWLAGWTALPQTAWWKQSLLAPYFVRMALAVHALAPGGLGKPLHYRES
ncbi:MAG: CvpA family protein [Betaproteobacteria bacterium]|nr:CvpA family protein [Betaproteobacteria bacterium]